jgi:hypothetical protein
LKSKCYNLHNEAEILRGHSDKRSQLQWLQRNTKSNHISPKAGKPEPA